MDEKNKLNLIHDIEELAELSKELTKALRGKLRRDKLVEEIIDVKVSICRIQEVFDIDDNEIKLCNKCKEYYLSNGKCLQCKEFTGDIYDKLNYKKREKKNE